MQQPLMTRLFAPLVRRRAALETAALDRYRVEVATDVDTLESAFALVQRAYVAKGIAVDRDRALRMTSQHMLREACVFVARERDRVVGTVTVTADSRAGLPLDKDYPDELARLRARGFGLAELGSLAVDPAHRRAGVTTLLFMAAHWVVRESIRADVLVVGVNPRIQAVYGSLFAFSRLGPEKRHAELAAPVVGLWHGVDAVRAHFERHFRRPMQNGRSVCDNFSRKLPDCIRLPPELGSSSTRPWQLEREVLHELFVVRSRCYRDADRTTLSQLRTQRSDDTLRLLGERAA